MIETWSVEFPARNGPDRRAVYVYLPDSWQEDPDLRYPVLYMFDGHNLFFDEDATYGKSWGMDAFLHGTGAQVIVAAVESSREPDFERLREYAPYSFSNDRYGSIEGLGRTTMEWYVHTFKREIDRRYPTIPDRAHTFIGGSSMGGLMSLYAVLAWNNVFSRAVALSPSLWTAPDKLRVLVRTARLWPDTVVYMDCGSQEVLPCLEHLDQFREMTDELLRKGVFVTSRLVPFGSHCEACWEKQLPFVLDILTYQS